MENMRAITELSDIPSHVPTACRLTVVEGVNAGAHFDLRQGTAIVGSDPFCDWTLSDRTVSSRHLEIRMTAHGVEVQDLESTNGSKYLGTRIQRAVMPSGAVLALGRTKVLFVNLDEKNQTVKPSETESRDRGRAEVPRIDNQASRAAPPSWGTPVPPSLDLGTPFPDARKRLMDAFETNYLSRQLERADNNLAAAARASGLDRSYFKRLLRRHQLMPNRPEPRPEQRA